MDSKKQEDLVLSIGPPLPPSVGPPLPPPPMFPWAADTPAIHHPLSVLVARGIRTVDGDFQCRSCKHRVTVAYDLLEKYKEVSVFLLDHGAELKDRAPAKWMHPESTDCSKCIGSKMRPVVAESGERINWLFLFLGQMLGACKLGQLKWFGKQAKFHSSGAKNCVVYYSYVAICSQLQPDGTFDHLLKRTNK